MELAEDYYGRKRLDKLLCPFCEFDYIHPGGVERVASDDYEAWDGRGSVLAITLECGHRFTLCLGSHKGQTFLFTSRPPAV